LLCGRSNCFNAQTVLFYSCHGEPTGTLVVTGFTDRISRARKNLAGAATLASRELMANAA